ncbi:hypothetical protein ABZ249_31405 [Nocardiopsis sp. NPDC006139]|uniref:hypothetical protein n=1 Tax=Nocardiopsis sp. NPDC006139 TaxID=3154578 RepID=UPI0033AA67D2
MIRFIHRQCQQELDRVYALLDHREEELEEVTRERADLRHAAVLAEVELGHLRERVRAADTENLCRQEHGHADSLEQQVAELEAELETWREHAEGLAGELNAYERAESVLAGRRRRVAAAALGDAAEYSARPGAAAQATVAAAVAVMPLEFFNPEIVAVFDGGRTRWLVDGEEAEPYGTEREAREQVIARYGLTEQDLDLIEDAARAQAAQDQEAA